jgi:hypothetical protein
LIRIYSDSEAESNHWQEVETKPMSEGQSRGFLDVLKRYTSSSSQSKVREENLMEKYPQYFSKFDKGHMIAMAEHVLYQKVSTER